MKQELKVVQTANMAEMSSVSLQVTNGKTTISDTVQNTRKCRYDITQYYEIK